MNNITFKKQILLGVFIVLLLISCNSMDNQSGSTIFGSRSTPVYSQDWLVPINEVIDGGPGKDGIPALVNPELVLSVDAAYLEDSELVLGYFDGENAIAYPHQILDWHEIINDELSGFHYAITYCPLTGTGIGWNRSINNSVTTFGVSGLLYNNNLIPYDRATDSNWSQMRLDCVNGELISHEIETVQLVETEWKTWKEMYASTRVVSLNTGYDRDYGNYPYGDYKTDNEFLLFPLSVIDRRLGFKERVHGIIVDGQAKAYRFSSFDPYRSLIIDVVNNREVLVIGNIGRNYIVSFYSELGDGTKPIFKAVSKNNVILEDNLGNQWDIFGYAVSGPNIGERLAPTVSFMGYWFAWGAFYPDLEIYR